MQQLTRKHSILAGTALFIAIGLALGLSLTLPGRSHAAVVPVPGIDPSVLSAAGLELTPTSAIPSVSEDQAMQAAGPPDSAEPAEAAVFAQCLLGTPGNARLCGSTMLGRQREALPGGHDVRPAGHGTQASTGRLQSRLDQPHDGRFHDERLRAVQR
jgi:hypothetical protein